MRSLVGIAAAVFAIAIVAAPGASAQSAKKQLLANATVKSLSATSITVTASGKDSTFGVDAKTKVVGKGLQRSRPRRAARPRSPTFSRKGTASR